MLEFDTELLGDIPEISLIYAWDNYIYIHAIFLRYHIIYLIPGMYMTNPRNEEYPEMKKTPKMETTPK